MRNRFRIIILGGLTLGACIAQAGGREDLAAFAARFDGLGLPDVSRAEYVHVLGCWRPRIEDPLPHDWESSGNAWLLRETRDAEGRPVDAAVVVDSSRVVDLIDRDAAKRSPQAEAGFLAPPPPASVACPCRWEPGDPAKDVKQALRFLESLEWDRIHSADPEQIGRLGLLALALRQRGDHENSVKLFTSLAARAGGVSNVTAAAMNLAANGQYGNLYDEFRKTADWQAFRDGLHALLARYPDGWRMAPVVQMLLSRVEDRLAGPAPMPVDSQDMTEIELRQAAAMLELRALRVKRDAYADPPALWLVPSSWRDRAPQPLDAELDIRVRGLEAVPFLLKLVPDGALTPADRAAVLGASVYRSAFDLSRLDRLPEGATGKKLIRQAYDAMDRPATRGEIALGWLQELVPEYQQGEYRRKNPEDQIAFMQDFYRRHRAKSEDELAVVCLPGTYSFHMEDLPRAYLLERARQEAIPALEEFLVSDRSWGRRGDERDRSLMRRARADLLIRYAFLRGEEARPLLERYAGILAADTNRTEQAEQLRHFPYEVPFEQMLADVPWENDQDHPVRKLLYARMEVMPLAEALGPVLEHAAAATNPAARTSLAYLLRCRAGNRPDEGLTATNHAAEWEALISDDRIAKSPSGAKIVSEQYLALNEHLFGGHWEPVPRAEENDWRGGAFGEHAAQDLMKIRGQRGREWVRARVRQRLAGVPDAELPPFPSPEARPDDSQLAGILRRLATVTSREEAAALVTSLSLAERSGLAELLREDPELNARLLPLASRIGAVLAEGDAGEWNRRLLEWEGELPTPDLLEQLGRCAEDMARSGKPVTCRLTRRADFGGCEVSLEARPVPPRYAKPGDAPWPVVGYGGLLCAPGLYGAAVWRTAPPPEEEKRWWAPATSDLFDLQRFERAKKEFFAPDVPACEEAIAVFQTKGERP